MRFGRTARCISLIILHHRRKFEAVVRRENSEKERMLNYVHSKNFMNLGSLSLVKVNLCETFYVLNISYALLVFAMLINVCNLVC